MGSRTGEGARGTIGGGVEEDAANMSNGSDQVDRIRFMPRGRHPRSILNEIKWRGYSLADAEIEILHRGAPHNRITARACDIILGKSFFNLGESEIPYHRIQVIRFRGEAVFRRSDIVKGGDQDKKGQ